MNENQDYSFKLTSAGNLEQVVLLELLEDAAFYLYELIRHQ